MSRRRQRKTITLEEITAVENLPQSKAAQKLGVSVTTLKKRFRELHPRPRRWPYRPYNQYKEHVKSHTINGVDERMTMEYICNMKNQNPTKNVRRMWKRHFRKIRKAHLRKLKRNNVKPSDRMIDEDEEDEYEDDGVEFVIDE